MHLQPKTNAIQQRHLIGIAQSADSKLIDRQILEL